MIVTLENNLYLARGFDTFERKGYLRDNGFVWDSELKAYKSTERPSNLFLYYWADDELFATTGYVFAKNEVESIEVDGALPHQGAGVNFLTTRKRCILADEQGLGKTFMCIKSMDRVGAKNVLVVCPLIATGNWALEILKFSEREDITFALTKNPPAEGITIIHFDALAKQKDNIDKIKWDILIVDECHKIKNKKADRSRQIYGYWKDGKWKLKKIVTEFAWFISGTPTTGRAYDMYPMLSYLDNVRFGWNVFTKRYAYKGRFGYDSYIGQNRLLQDEMAKTGIMLRRLKSEVWKDMPSKNYKFYTNKLSSFKLTKEQKQILKDAEMSLEEVNSIDGLDISTYSAVRKLTGMLKIESSVEIALDILEGNDQLVIGAVHREVIETIAERLMAEDISCAIIYGGSKDRVDIIRRFQAKEIRVVVANIISAGTAINLFSANNLLFAEKEWNETDNDQFSDRIHRFGQDKPCYYHNNYMEDTIDELIYRANSRKKAVFKRIMGG